MGARPSHAAWRPRLRALIVRPGDRLLGWTGWVWPLLLALLVVWSVRGARRSLDNWSRRALLYPAFAVLGLVALGGAFETVAEATTSNPALGRSHLPRRWPPSLPELRRLGISNRGAVQRPRRANTELGLGAERRRSPDPRLCLRPCGPGLERQSAGAAGRTPTRRRPSRASLGRARSRPLRPCRSLRRRHLRPRLRDGLSEGHCRGRADRLGVPAPVRPAGYPGFYSMWRRVGALLPSVGRAGIPRLTSGMGSGGLPSDARREARAFNSSPRELRADHDEFAELRTVFDQTKALTTLDGKPLFVLTADLGQQSGWSAAQDKLATLSTNSPPSDDPGRDTRRAPRREHFASVTSGAIGAVVQAARSGEPIER